MVLKSKQENGFHKIRQSKNLIKESNLLKEFYEIDILKFRKNYSGAALRRKQLCNFD